MGALKVWVGAGSLFKAGDDLCHLQLRDDVGSPKGYIMHCSLLLDFKATRHPWLVSPVG